MEDEAGRGQRTESKSRAGCSTAEGFCGRQQAAAAVNGARSQLRRPAILGCRRGEPGPPVLTSVGFIRQRVRSIALFRSRHARVLPGSSCLTGIFFFPPSVTDRHSGSAAALP